MAKRKHSRFLYGLTKFVSGIVSRAIFKRKILRNELRGKKGPAVVIANHQAALDFVNLIGITGRPMTFVISNSFYSSIPVTPIMKRLDVIPKQQFQTSMKDLHQMKDVIDGGGILALYPAGLMCEDGLSTPIPQGTYKFLKWLKADVYMARSYGSYFVMPKWAKGFRPGRTYIDVYKLFSKEELSDISPEELKERTDRALLFDAYKDQENRPVKYKKCDNIEGLEQVLYKCPHCGGKYTVKVKDKSVIYCARCGFEERADCYGFLHKTSEVGEEIRYVSDWASAIFLDKQREVRQDNDLRIDFQGDISTVNHKKHKFVHRGQGKVTITKQHLTLTGNVSGEEIEITLPTCAFPSMPFKPGRYLELQHESDIFRIFPTDGSRVMEYVNTVKAIHLLHDGECQRCEQCHQAQTV